MTHGIPVCLLWLVMFRAEYAAVIVQDTVAAASFSRFVRYCRWRGLCWYRSRCSRCRLAARSCCFGDVILQSPFTGRLLSRKSGTVQILCGSNTVKCYQHAPPEPSEFYFWINTAIIPFSASPMPDGSGINGDVSGHFLLFYSR